jgi:hypothetical protein
MAHRYFIVLTRTIYVSSLAGLLSVFVVIAFIVFGFFLFVLSFHARYTSNVGYLDFYSIAPIRFFAHLTAKSALFCHISYSSTCFS